MDEIREITIDQAEEPKKDLNPFDYVTIPLKEYTKMVRKIEKFKMREKAGEEIANALNDVEQYRRWWSRDEDEIKKLKEALEEAKSQLRELLGVEELKEEE